MHKRCTKCGGELDTGYICISCGYNNMPIQSNARYTTIQKCDCLGVSKPIITVYDTKYAKHELYFYNGRYLGTFIKEEDGYYVYWPEYDDGYWTAPVLRIIADLLDNLNAEWNRQVQNDLRI